MPSEEEEIINLIAQELMSGKSPDTVVGELVQAGLPQNEAVTVVNAVAREVAQKKGGGAPGRGPPGRGAPMKGPPPRRPHGSNMTLIVMILAVLVLLYVAFYA